MNVKGYVKFDLDLVGALAEAMEKATIIKGKDRFHAMYGHYINYGTSRIVNALFALASAIEEHGKNHE
jgi:hypothetical protein